MPKRKKRSKIKIVLRKLGREQALGLCWKDKDLVEIDDRLDNRWTLKVLVHELLHAVCKEMSETDVERRSRKMAEGIWRMGYRRIAD